MSISNNLTFFLDLDFRNIIQENSNAFLNSFAYIMMTILLANWDFINFHKYNAVIF